MKDEILKYLREADDYISGQVLCDRFHVSRTAIWKVINQLKQEGYVIDSVKNRGYRLIDAPDLITAGELSSQIHTVWAGQHVCCKESLVSTNQTAKQLAEEGAVHGTLVVAEQQTGGRGRRGRSWHSPKGSGIWMSLILRPELAPTHASMLTLVAAMAVYDALSAQVEGCAIKWPNDIVIDGKKVCGILTEMSTDMLAVQYVVVGIGINVNTEAFPEEITDVAASMHVISGAYYRRSPIIAAICQAFEKYYGLFMAKEDLSSLQALYNEHLVNRQRRVSIIERDVKYEGTAEGIDAEGSLLVRMDDGTIKTVISGEVSVRGILGYV